MCKLSTRQSTTTTCEGTQVTKTVRQIHAQGLARMWGNRRGRQAMYCHGKRAELERFTDSTLRPAPLDRTTTYHNPQEEIANCPNFTAIKDVNIVVEWSHVQGSTAASSM